MYRLLSGLLRVAQEERWEGEGAIFRQATRWATDVFGRPMGLRPVRRSVSDRGPGLGRVEGCSSSGVPGSDEKLYTYTIITTDSNASLKFLHDRMPVILDHGSDAIWVWLDPARSTWSTELQSLLRPYQGALDVYPVRKEVGKVGNNSAAFIVPLSSSADKHSIANFLNRGKAVKPDQAPTSTSDHRDDRSRIKCDDDNRATVSSDINPDSRAPPSIPTRPDTAPPDRKRKAVEDDEGSSSTADGDEAGNASSTAPVTRPFTRRRRPRCATSNVTAKSRPDRSSSAIDGSRTITQFWGGVDE